MHKKFGFSKKSNSLHPQSTIYTIYILYRVEYSCLAPHQVCTVGCIDFALILKLTCTSTYSSIVEWENDTKEYFRKCIIYVFEPFFARIGFRINTLEKLLFWKVHKLFLKLVIHNHKKQKLYADFKNVNLPLWQNAPCKS
jgi:hypothetical protein